LIGLSVINEKKEKRMRKKKERKKEAKEKQERESADTGYINDDYCSFCLTQTQPTYTKHSEGE
jgi:CRISPR/Cas system-associated protein Cas10 (large subunit of type III CRISPR-Cas system)